MAMDSRGFRTRTNKRVADYSYDHMWPEETCPVCGKKWIRMCRRREWGYWYNNSESQLTSQLTLLCSSECSRKYAEDRLLKEVRKTMESRCAQAIRLVETEKLTYIEAARRVGLKTSHGIDAFKALRWRELDWLRAHNWEVPA